MAALRVLSVFEYGSLHGGEHSWLAVAKQLAKHGVELLAAAPNDTPLFQAICALDIACHHVEVERGRAPDDDRLLQQLEPLVASGGVDVVHANSLSMSRRVGRIADRLDVPAVGHLRDIIKLSRKAVSDLNCNGRLIAVSEATKRFHVQQGLAGQRADVVRNGIDLTRFRTGNTAAREQLREQLQLPPDAVAVLSIGQIGIRKGLDVAADAMVRLAGRWPALHWLVAGERFSSKDESVEFERRVRKTAEQMGAGRARFLGVRNDVPELLSAGDVLLHAARQEPLGRVLLEAAAAGLAIVATDVGGTAEILTDRQSALLVEPDNVNQLATAVQHFVSDPALRAALGKEARREVERRFRIEQAAEGFAASLRQAAARS